MVDADSWFAVAIHRPTHIVSLSSNSHFTLIATQSESHQGTSLASGSEAPGAQKLVIFVLLVDLLAVAAAVLIYMITGEERLGEGSFLTHLSAIQLFAIAVIAFRIFRVRSQGGSRIYHFRNSQVVWALIAAGFLFLVADELFKIHENTDALIHSAFQLPESGWTDRIDDLLILSYALVGLGVIAVYRSEFVIMKKGMPFFIAGFVALFLMIGLDVLTNRDDLVGRVVDRDRIRSVQTVLSFAEEGMKILSGGLFVIAFFIALRVARRAG